MIKFFKNFGDKFEINGLKWKDCGYLLKVSGILTILTYLIIVATLVKIVMFSGDLSVKMLASIFIILLCNTVKITYEK